jgi:DNA-directed RNA polymerases I and III subunit RPAC1
MNILEQPDENTLVFEMLHCDTSFVNALRRILLSEVPTVALEHVYMWNNSSIIHDEVLAHRLGLIPLDLDARLLDDVEDDDYDGDEEGGEFTPTDRNTVVFRLAVSCPSQPPPNNDDDENDDDAARNNNSSRSLDDYDDDAVVQPNHPELEEAAAEAAAAPRKLKFPQDRPYTKHVYSKDFVWVPQGDQEETLKSVKPVHDDILIAKLRPGQAIELEAHGRRGIGKDHAKYSPVATASYRLYTDIELLEPVYDEVAEELVHVYEPGVFELIPTDETDPPDTIQKARVCNPYACTMSRNYMRHPKLKQAIRMSRVADHFIFSVESVGAYSPGVLVAEALRVLQRKCQRVMDLVDESTLRTEI